MGGIPAQGSNADMWASVPSLHIASIGIEKLIPRTQDLGVFIRMLARSAFGSPMSQFTSHFHGPRRGGELHVVLVDNKQSERLGTADFWRALKWTYVSGRRRSRLMRPRDRSDSWVIRYPPVVRIGV